ncbi:xanthine dehydrogenase family protein molybdopterin-binding subunit [Neobacillus niacini]|uniref:xanthine dehydrogenase family protein molybdopterin-binding subunit n=1 Tax=Neobacillus niacini TaxID=86668 RepID=UPI003B02D606
MGTVLDSQDIKDERKYIGRPIKRREDKRLLTGKGEYLDDIKLVNMLHVAFLRSPYAHAKIIDINVSKALEIEGVEAIFTGKDLVNHVGIMPIMSNVYPGVQEREKPILKPQTQRALAYDKVHFVGEPIAAIIAKSRAIAEDGLQLIDISYEPLEAVVDPEISVTNDSPLLHQDWGDNVAVSYKVEAGDVQAAFAQSDFVLQEELKINRQSPNPMETRGVVSKWDEQTNSLTVWSSTQMPHKLRSHISSCLGLPEMDIRVIAPNVGGGFGGKALIYPEEIAMSYFAAKLKIPLKWTEDRLEHMTSAAHARDQLHKVEIGFMKDGTITGLRDELILDTGAHSLYGINSTYNTAAHLPGPYRILNYECEVKVAVTNKTPCSQYRGAGRPEAVFVMDRMIDIIAKKLQIDPVEVRRRNLITLEEMPFDTGRIYKDGKPLVYDSGDYHACFEKTVNALNLKEFRKEQKKAVQDGRFLGIGFSAYVEGTGQGPHDGCKIEIDPTGTVLCKVSSADQGQGHKTTWAQICAETLGVNIESVQVIIGDTGAIRYGNGTYGSRSTVVSGSAVLKAAQEIRKKALKIASVLLEVPSSDLKIELGRVSHKEYEDRGYTYAELAEWVKPNKLPSNSTDIEPGLQAEIYFIPETVTYSNGVHGAIVEVDTETGKIDILNYVVAHDAGKIINPLIADGQLMGGVAQGIGGAIYEEIVYDKNGQLLTGTYMDYLLPTASEIPEITAIHMESPSPRNPLGVKGLGEGGTISPPAVLANAIEDALSQFDLKINKLPLSPNYIWSLLNNR